MSQPLPPALSRHAFGRSGCALTDNEPVLAARSRGSAAECAEDALLLLRKGDVARARNLLESALSYLDTYDTRMEARTS
jgi:hypothetical protein